MNPQSFSDYNPKISQSQGLSQTVEDLEVKLERLQALAQTLIGGLMVAILITIGVSGWFAYRLILQEQQARRKQQEFDQTKVELQERIDSLEQQLSQQQRQLERLEEKIPENLEQVTNTVNSNQEQISGLQQDINQLQNSENRPTSSAKDENKNNNN